ncbi:MAG: hypothetical protein U0452_14030 [Anaerolineae bacterium]
MSSRRPLFALLTTILLILLAGAVVAQVAAPAACPALVVQALRTVNNLCEGQGRNSACYGNYLVEAQLAADQPADLFAAQGDIAALNALTSLKTAPLNVDLSEWGVSLLSVQANIPNSLPGQNALFMLIGGAEIESAVPENGYFEAAATPLALHAIVDAVVRERPDESEAISRSVIPGDALLADARSGEYVRVVAGDQFGWIRTDQTDAASAAVMSLPEFTQGASFTPMQAFYLRTGIGQPLCSQAPSALVVQGPQGLHVNIEANGADITLGSTILLRSYSVEEALQAGLPIVGSDETGGLLELSVIDGRAIVRQKDGTLLYINEGSQSFICLDNPANRGADGQSNDQSITYACGGWTAPNPIPQSIRDEFSLVDDYPLIYPIDIMTATPTSAPTQTGVAPTATGVAATPSGSSFGIRASISVTPMASAALPSFAGAGYQLPSFLFDARVTVMNRSQRTLNSVAVAGVGSQANGASAEATQGYYDPASGTWFVGTLSPGAEASLRLLGTVTATCGQVITGSIHVSSPDDPGTSLPYAISVDCENPTATWTPPSTAIAPTVTPSDTPTLTPVSPTATATDTATNTPLPSATASATATDTATSTPLPPTATGTATNTPVPPTATDTATNTPVPTATDTPTNTRVPPTPTNTPVPPTATPTSVPTSTDRVTICHNFTTTLVLPAYAAYDVHLNADGTGRTGEHQNDYLGPCLPTPDGS